MKLRVLNSIKPRSFQAYWDAQDNNGRIVADGAEMYSRTDDACEGLANFLHDVMSARIEVVKQNGPTEEFDVPTFIEQFFRERGEEG